MRCESAVRDLPSPPTIGAGNEAAHPISVVTTSR